MPMQNFSDVSTRVSRGQPDLGKRLTAARLEHDPEKHFLDLIGDGNRFSQKIMLKLARQAQ
jgi:hypothetical protein